MCTLILCIDCVVNGAVAFKHAFERVSCLHSCQRRTDAEMDTVAKGVMIAALSIQPKVIWLLIVVWISICSPKQGIHRISFGNLLAVKLGINQCVATYPVNGWVITQTFFDSGITGLRVLSECLPDTRVVSDVVQQVAKQVGGGFVASDE